MDRLGCIRDMNPLEILCDNVIGFQAMDPMLPPPEGQTANLAEKVKLMGKDGGVVEADVKALMGTSVHARKMIEEFGTDGIFPVPCASSRILELVVDWCERLLEMRVRYPISRLSRALGVRDNTDQVTMGVERIDESDTLELTDQEILDRERFFQEIAGTNLINKFCTLKYDVETIKELHEAADFLHIPSLLHFTNILIREAPSRAFMGIVSPWVDYNSLEAYRYRTEVAAF